MLAAMVPKQGCNMKLNEMMGDYQQYDDSTAMKLAKQFLRGSKCDVKKANMLADRFANEIKNKIARHGKMMCMRRTDGEKVEPSDNSPRHTGYDDMPEPRPNARFNNTT